MLAAGHQVQGVLGVGEDPHGAGSALVEGVGVAEGVQVGRDPGQGLVEELCVGGLQGHGDLGGRRGGAVAQPHPAPGQGLLFIGHGAVGVEEQPCLRDQAGWR